MIYGLTTAPLAINTLPFCMGLGIGGSSGSNFSPSDTGQWQELNGETWGSGVFVWGTN